MSIKKTLLTKLSHQNGRKEPLGSTKQPAVYIVIVFCVSPSTLSLADTRRAIS